MEAAPKASVCFLGGTREIFGGPSEDLLGGNGKAGDAKLPGVGIIPKQCPMERVGMGITDQGGLYIGDGWTWRDGQEWVGAGARASFGISRATLQQPELGFY